MGFVSCSLGFMRYIHAKVARTAGVAPALGVLEALTLYRVVRMERDVGIAPTHSAFAERRLAVLANPSKVVEAEAVAASPWSD